MYVPRSILNNARVAVKFFPSRAKKKRSARARSHGGREPAARDRWHGCVSVIVPVYNEIAHLDDLLRAVLASPVRKEVIIVDDRSTDGTREKLRELPAMDNVTILFHEKNCGKGASIRT